MLFQERCGAGDWSLVVQSRQIPAPGNRVSGDCPCHAHTIALLVRSQPSIQLELRVILFHPYSICQPGHNAGDPKPGLKAQQKLFHFW